jgi:hypothetical protein
MKQLRLTWWQGAVQADPGQGADRCEDHVTADGSHLICPTGGSLSQPQHAQQLQKLNKELQLNRAQQQGTQNRDQPGLGAVGV